MPSSEPVSSQGAKNENPQLNFNPLVPDAHYSERQDKPFSLQIQRLEVDLSH